MNFQRFNQLLRLGVSPQAADEDSALWKGSEKQKTSSTNTSTPYQQKDYDTLLGKSNDWLNGGGFDKNYGGSAGFDPTANLTAQQQAGLNGSYATAEGAQGLYNDQGLNTLGNYFGSYDPSKTGLNGAIEASNNQLDWNYNTQVNPQIRQGATDAGQFGSTRHGVAEGIAQSQLSQQKTNAASTMAFQDQQQFNQNQLGVLNNLSQITRGLNSGNGLMYDTGSNQQQQDQNEINGQLQQWAYNNNVSLNDLLAYKSLISGDMGGTTNSKGESTGGGGGGSGGLGALGAIGGAALGSMVMPGVGTAMGAQLGGQLGGSLG